MKMIMTKERFLQLAEDCFISKEDYMKSVNRLLESGAVDLENLPDDYRAVYPVVTAIYERETQWFINGSSDDKWKRKARRDANNYKWFI